MKKKWLLFSLACVAAALVVVPRLFAEKEPIHRGKKISGWIRELAWSGGPNPAAEDALTELGSTAVPYLIAALGDNELLRDKFANFFGRKPPSPAQRYMFPPGSAGLRRLRATVVLGRIGPRAADAVPTLIRLLTSDAAALTKGTNVMRVADQYLRQEAVAALKSIGIPGRQAAPALSDLLTNRDYRVRWAAADLVTNIQPPFTREMILGLAAALKSEDERGRPNVLLALKRCQPFAETAWPDLVANLQHTNAAVRASAAESLGMLAPAKAPVLAALERAAHDEQPQVRLEAAYALWRNEPASEARFLPCVLDRLRDEKPFWRRKAARYAGEMRPAAHDAIPLLESSLNDPDPETRILAARAIVQIAPEQADVVVPILRDALLDRGPRRRTWTAAQILGDLGPRARAAIPALAEAMDDASAPAATAAAEAMEKIEPGLAAKLRKDPAARRTLVLPELIRALGGSLEMRGFAFQSLKRFGAEAREAVPQMIAALEHPDLKNPRYDWIWLRALDALGAVGPSATNAAPLLLEALRHETVAIRSSAASALSRIGVRSPEAISALIKTLEDDEPVVRAYAARALGAFGPAAKEALPALETALRSEELQLHAMAMSDAIKKIAPQRLQEIERAQRAEQAQKRP